MFHSTVTRFLWVGTALLLSACAAQHQAPAPVVASTEAGGTVYNPYSPNPVDGITNPYGSNYGTNPYGATPYTPSGTAAAAPNNTVYQPTAAPLPTVPGMPDAINNLVGNVNGVYIGNYSPVDTSATTHHVTAGDTIYNIAKRYHISQDNLRAWNNLSDNTINLGQVLRVKAPSGSSQSTTAANVASTNNPVFTPPPVPKNSSVPTTPTAQLVWTAPVKGGTIVRSFGNGNQGIDISGTRGQSVFAAADGQVAYSGSNLRGYGKLIIIQHNAEYLTAYGHNDTLLVREGQYVRGGQEIARMGNSDSSNGVKLHFEIRENGNPLNPNRFVKF